MIGRPFYKKFRILGFVGQYCPDFFGSNLPEYPLYFSRRFSVVYCNGYYRAYRGANTVSCDQQLRNEVKIWQFIFRKKSRKN